MKKTHLVIGLGEVGKALQKVLNCDGYDNFQVQENDVKHQYDVLHIAIPYSDDFIEIVKEYETQFKSELTIIHSSVPIGTSKKLNAVHSPIRGVHPDLTKGIRTFTKYFGGERAIEAAEYFGDLDIPVIAFTGPTGSDNTEALKLWDTTQYGKMILLEKEIYKWCQENNIDFNFIYTQANKDYNEGYVKLGKPEVVRPYLTHMEGPIGGHCVNENAKLLGIEL